MLKPNRRLTAALLAVILAMNPASLLAGEIGSTQEPAEEDREESAIFDDPAVPERAGPETEGQDTCSVKVLLPDGDGTAVFICGGNETVIRTEGEDVFVNGAKTDTKILEAYREDAEGTEGPAAAMTGLPAEVPGSEDGEEALFDDTGISTGAVQETDETADTAPEAYILCDLPAQMGEEAGISLQSEYGIREVNINGAAPGGFEEDAPSYEGTFVVEEDTAIAISFGKPSADEEGAESPVEDVAADGDTKEAAIAEEDDETEDMAEDAGAGTEEELLEEDEFEEEIPTLNTASVYYLKNGFQSEYTVTSKPQYSYKGTGYNFAANSNDPHYTSLIIATNTLRGTSTKFICVEPSLYGYVENSKFYADDEVLTDETLIKILYYGALGYAGTNHALQYAGNSYAGSVVLTHVSAARRIYQLNRGREHGNADYAFGAANGSQVWKYGGNTALENATTNYINHVKSLAMPTGVTVLITNGIYKSTGNWVQKYVAIIKDGYLVIQKKSANTSVTNGNSLYNFSGIKYGIYADSGCTKLVKEVTLSADGKSPSVELLPGNYWIKETEGNNYYKKSGTVTKVTVSESSTKTQSVSDQPNLDLEPFTITKQVYDKNGGQLTGFDLSGFQFTIEYYDKWINYNGSNVSGTPVRKWIVQTDSSGVAKLDSDHLVSGSSALYKDADGNVGLPVGHLRVTETKIPAKYEGMMEHSGKWGIRYKDRSDDSWKNGTYSIASDGSINYHLTHFDYYTGDSGYNTHLYGRVDGSNDNVQVSEIRNTAQNVITYDTGTLTVRKRDKEAASAGMATGTIQGTAQNFQGAMYDVINNTGGTVIYKGITYQNGAVVASFTTNADGWARVSGLQTGAYILRETSAIEGYQLAPDKDVTIEADVDNSYMGNGNGLLEEPKRNDFILKKTDTSGKAMANVLFRIEDSNGNAQEFSTGDDGTFSSAGSDVWFGVTGKIAGKGALPYGTYTVTELSCDANEGVKSLADPVTFTVGDGSPAVIDLGTVRNQLAPVIDTLLTDEDGAHSGNPEDPMSLTDTVTLSHLEEYIGKTLTIKGSLYDKTTGNVVATAQETAAVTAGNAASMEKTVTFSFDGTLIAGHALVAVEELYDGGTLVAEHRDMADADQTYTVNPNEPLVATVLTDSASAHTGDVGASVTLTDKVTLYNFQSYIGQTITVKGKLVRKDTGATIKEATKTIAITAENAAKASVSVTFTFDSSALAGKSLVAYEYAMSGQTEIAKHEEASDAQQTYTFKFKTPVMATVLQDGAGAHHGPVGADVSLTDKVTIKDLEEYIGKTVTIKGKLIDKATGNTVASKQGTVIVTEANAAQLSSNIVFTFDASSYAGRTLVAYETASVGTKEIAKHEDANDTDQSYTFDYKTPSMETVLTNASGAHSGNTGSSVKLTDKVILYDLEEYIGQTITINGSLMDGTTAVATKNAALAVTADNAKEAEVSMTFTVNASRLAGKTIVAYEKAVIGTKTIASHEDPSDADQSYTFNYNTPSVTTVLTDAASSHTGDAGGTITLTDKVTMKNLERYIGKTLTIKGVLMDVTTGESVLEATKSHAVTKANAYSSSENMTFKVTADALAGHVLVAYEYVLDGTAQIAKHEDKADEAQTYTFNYKTPVIATVLHDAGGNHAAAPSGTVTLTDTVSLKNFEEYIGKTAQIRGELRDKETGDLVEEAQASVSITAAKAASLTRDVAFTIDGMEYIGKSLVAYEYVYVDDQKITEHADSNDADQTYTFSFIPPSVDTILRDENEKHAGKTAKNVVLNDSVELIHFEQYKGKTATINGRLIDKVTGAELAKASRQHAITDSNCSDSVETLSFTIDASALAGKSVVAYETVTINGSVVARHEDPEDADQTYSFDFNTPRASTVLLNSAGSHKGPASGSVTLTDKVTLENFEAYIGKTLTIKGQLTDKATGDVMQEAQGTIKITAANAASASVNIPFTFDASAYPGKSLVAYEYVYDGTKLVTSHDDKNDADQTYTFDYNTPSVATVLQDGSGKHSGKTGNSITLTDRVSLKNFEQYTGQTVTVKGRLMDKASGKEVAAKNVTVKITQANAANASVDVVFTLDASLMAGKSLVAYETAVVGSKTIAKHEDANDADQTYTFDYNKPGITTVLTDSKGAHSAVPAGNMTLTDKVVLTDLEQYIGKTLTIKGRLVEKAGKKTAAEGQATLAVTAANAHSSTVNVTFKVASDSYAGKSLVAFEYLLDGTAELAKHEDLNDADQTYTFGFKKPLIATVLHDKDMAHKGAPSENVTLTDTVSLKNFEEYIGKTAQIKGQLYEDGTMIQEKTVTVGITEKNAASLTKDVAFTVNGMDHIGKSLVAYEYVYVDGKKITEHADANDADQTYTFDYIEPSVKTVLQDGKGAQNGRPEASVTLSDKVQLIHFEEFKGTNVQISGQIVDRETGEVLASAQKQHAVTEANCADSSETLSFTFNADKLAGRRVVAYEYVTAGSKEIAKHADPDDADQTYTFDYKTPRVTTILQDADGNKAGNPASSTTLVDHVVLEDFEEYIGKVLTIKGELHDADTGELLTEASDGLTVTAANAAKAEKDITFAFDASAFENRKVVAYEYVSVSGKDVASHEDPEDQDQQYSFNWTVTLIKKDASDKHLLPGALFGLYSPQRADQKESGAYPADVQYQGRTWYFVSSEETDENGRLTFAMPRDSMLVWELKAPGGYLLPQDQGLAVSRDEDHGKEKEVLNEAQSWGFTIKKVSSEDGSVLEGARFGIYSKDRQGQVSDQDAAPTASYGGSTWYLAVVAETGRDGLAEVTGLKDSQYLVMEVKAPDGYYAGDEGTRIVTRDEDKGQTIEIKNIPGSELPVTGGHGSWYVYMLSAMFIMAAVLLARRKKA